jgi:hypoxanthine phosphoribosyltransferase
MNVHEDIARVLIDEDVIRRRIDEMAPRILDDLGKERIVVVVLLKGAFVFTADLLRRLPVRLDIECINVASYHGGTESSGQVKFLDQKLPDVKERHVLLVDDILDTGRTLKAVSEAFIEKGAKKVKSCVLLAKEKERAVEQEADYIGFTIGDEFVVGYGLDYLGMYRNLPYVGVLHPSLVED